MPATRRASRVLRERPAIAGDEWANVFRQETWTDSLTRAKTLVTPALAWLPLPEGKKRG